VLKETCSNFQHGHRSDGKSSPTFSSWKSALCRCNDRRNEDYGGRRMPVRVCERFRVFVEFLADLGDRPDGMTLDRKDSRGHYSCGRCSECEREVWPANCRWATPVEQNREQRKLTSEQVAQILADARAQHRIAADFGVCQMTISNVKRGRVKGYL
jgi:hypothetical protein